LRIFGGPIARIHFGGPLILAQRNQTHDGQHSHRQENQHSLPEEHWFLMGIPFWHGRWIADISHSNPLQGAQMSWFCKIRRENQGPNGLNRCHPVLRGAPLEIKTAHLSVSRLE
jgi:hypothetical protein